MYGSGTSIHAAACVVLLQADCNGDVLNGPEAVSDGLTDLSARDREL